MALAVPHSFNLGLEAQVDAFTTSIAASPVAAQIRAPFRGHIVKFGCVTGGAIGTTTNVTVTVSTNGTNLNGGTFTINAVGAAAGQVFTGVPQGGPPSVSAANGFVNEDDAVTLTPANGSGASVPGTFFVTFRRI